MWRNARGFASSEQVTGFTPQEQAGPLHAIDAAGNAVQFAVLGPEFRAARGSVAARSVTFGSQTLNFTSHARGEVGQYRVACVRAATAEGSCSSPAFCLQVSGALRHPWQAIPLFPSGLIRNQTKPSERLVSWARASEALASKRMRDLCLRALFKACLGRGWCERRRRQAQSTPSVVHACMRTA